MNAKNFKYYHIFMSSIPRALSEQKYNFIVCFKNQKDKPKITYGRFPKLIIKKLWLKHTNNICETEQ